MRCLARNKQTIYYATYGRKAVVLDANGNETSDYAITYSAPVKIRANVSASRGTAEQEMFGVGVNYTKTVVIDAVDLPIDEHSIMWIGKTPADNAKHNYVVVQVAKSLNSVAYAVREVDVS